jgi:hypothetical protein
VLVERDDRTIWTCYSRAKKKRGSKEHEIEPGKSQKHSQEQIPLNILKNRNFAPLESISFFLKNTKGMSFHEIALLLNRDDRTIWTCCNRATKKIQQTQENKK